MNLNEFIPKIAMSIHAHPDDQEFTVGGTLAYWSKNNCQVISVLVTSGEAGSNDPAHGREYQDQLQSIREAEQSAANEILGISETIYLHYPDGTLEPTLELRHDLTRQIRQHKPEVLVIGDPQGLFYGNSYINHPDHRAAAQAALYAAFPSSGTRLIFIDLLEEGLEPHSVQQIYIHGTETKDVWMDISTTIDLKIQALKQHRSQLGDWDPEQMIREWAKDEAKGRDMEYAEGYKVMVLNQEDEE